MPVIYLLEAIKNENRSKRKRNYRSTDFKTIDTIRTGVRITHENSITHYFI